MPAEHDDQQRGDNQRRTARDDKCKVGEKKDRKNHSDRHDPFPVRHGPTAKLEDGVDQREGADDEYAALEQIILDRHAVHFAMTVKRGNHRKSPGRRERQIAEIRKPTST